VYYEGTREPIATFLLRNAGQTATDYLGFFDSLDAASAGVDPLHPELAANAAVLDATSLDTFISGLRLVPEAEFLVRLEYRGEYNAEAADLSMLFIAQQNNGESPGELGVESMRVQGGNSRLTAALASALGPRVRLASPVDRISVGADAVSVRSGSTVVEGSHVVLAAPLMALRGVEFDPPLPPAAQALVRGQGRQRVQRSVLDATEPLGVHADRPALPHRMGGHRQLRIDGRTPVAVHHRRRSGDGGSARRRPASHGVRCAARRGVSRGRLAAHGTERYQGLGPGAAHWRWLRDLPTGPDEAVLARAPKGCRETALRG